MSEKRWSLSNKKNKPISQQQYDDLVHTFYKSFTDRHSYTWPDFFVTNNPAYCTLFDGENKNSLFKPDMTDDETVDIRSAGFLKCGISETDWTQSRFIEHVLRPEQKNGAFGSVQFRGLLPQTATFYVQGDDFSNEIILSTMKKTGKNMILGPGLVTNGLSHDHYVSEAYEKANVKPFEDLLSKQTAHLMLAQKIYQKEEAGPTFWDRLFSPYAIPPR